MSKVSPISPVPSDKGEVNYGSHDEKHPHHSPERGSIVNAAVSEWRHFMHSSGWYDSAIAISIRKFLRGKLFAVMTMISLFIALFASDCFVIFKSENNTALNIILVLVLLIFSFEFFGLATTDASYFLSFFFWMDFLGTVSLIFDISFMLGTDAEVPEKHSGGGAEDNIIVVRAARATKLGARAGRLSRVMKLLRFLPVVRGTGQDSDVKLSRVISHQLTNVLSTRVAFLTICIVVVLPIFGIFAYPEADDSLATWTKLLSKNSHELADEYNQVPQNPVDIANSRIRLDREINAFFSFYTEMSYGPFAACFGQMDDSCNCQTKDNVTLKYSSTFEEPGRRNFVRIVTQNYFAACFDLSTPKQLEALASASLIIFIIVVMITFGLVTSQAITIIALLPLERMLSVVRERCRQIFKYTDLLEEDDESGDDDEDYEDTADHSEFALLEKVVAKLAAIASLTNSKDEPEVKEGMTEDEVMTLNWMQGTTGWAVPKRRLSQVHAGDILAQEILQAQSDKHDPVNHSVLDNIPSDVLEALEGPSFCTIDLTKEVMTVVAAHIILTQDGCGVWVHQNIQEVHLMRFVKECESRYQANPFHNFAHALDVEYSAGRHMRLMEAERFLPETSQFWLIVAAVAHDLGHLGVNNQYLIETSHELALKYNDRSPLENMHCASLFQVVSDPAANLFQSVEKDLYKEMRKGIINAILHTDVTKHGEMMKELVLLYQMNSEAFDVQKADASGPTADVIEVLQNNSQLTLNAILHTADVGNPMKPWEIAHRLAYLCVDEFFAQGDREKAAGIPVQMLNDRDKVNRPNSQIGFIEFVIAPLCESIVHLFPTLDFLAENLGININHWFEVWVEQTSPAAEVKSKTEARVTKVFNRCQNVMRTEDMVSERMGSKTSLGSKR